MTTTNKTAAEIAEDMAQYVEEKTIFGTYDRCVSNWPEIAKAVLENDPLRKAAEEVAKNAELLCMNLDVSLQGGAVVERRFKLLNALASFTKAKEQA